MDGFDSRVYEWFIIWTSAAHVLAAGAVHPTVSQTHANLHLYQQKNCGVVQAVRVSPEPKAVHAPVPHSWHQVGMICHTSQAKSFLQFKYVDVIYGPTGTLLLLDVPMSYDQMMQQLTV
jgi:hypothetical protein